MASYNLRSRGNLHAFFSDFDVKNVFFWLRNRQDLSTIATDTLLALGEQSKDDPDTIELMRWKVYDISVPPPPSLGLDVNIT